MTEYAYLNAADEVLATGQTLRQPNELKVPGVVTTITGAPAGLRPKNNPFWATYHRRVSGDGTDLAHYTEESNTIPPQQAPENYGEASDLWWGNRTSLGTSSGSAAYLTVPIYRAQAGVYRLGWSAIWRPSKKGRDYWIAVLVDGEEVSRVHESPGNDGDELRFSAAAFVTIDLAAGDRTLTVQMGAEKGTIYVYRAEVELAMRRASSG